MILFDRLLKVQFLINKRKRLQNRINFLQNDISRDIILFKDRNWNENTQILKSEKEIEAATRAIKRLKLDLHHDRPKNWDLLLSILSTLNNFPNRKSRILDAGSGSKAVFARSMKSLNYEEVHACDLQEIRTPKLKSVVCDLISTPYPNDYFDIIACLSVIEHGIDLEKFAYEMHRICKPGGKLILSTDYWPKEEDHSSKFPYGKNNPPMMLFSNKSIVNLNKILSMNGWKTPHFQEVESLLVRPVRWERMDAEYTFLWLQATKLSH